jgi:hypothetical protein
MAEFEIQVNFRICFNCLVDTMWQESLFFKSIAKVELVYWGHNSCSDKMMASVR